MKKAIEDFTDEELLDMLDVPEEKIVGSIKSHILGSESWDVTSGEAYDLITGDLERRHGDAEALRIVGKRFGF